MRFEDALVFVFGLIIGAFVALVAARSARAAAAPRPPPSSPAESDSELSTALDQLDVGVIWLDADLVVSRLNRAAARLVPVSQTRAVGRSVMETFLDHRVADAARAALAEGSASVEITPNTDGARQLQLRLRTSADGGLIIVVDDVTELRRLQRIRSEFIDNLSHELRTPLTTIRLLTETLAQEVARPDVTVTPRVRERIEKIDVETGHLAQMVSELLDLSRIEGGAADFQMETVRIPEVVDGALERLRTFADRQRVGLTSELDNSLPPAWGDANRISQVLINLLHNALKFSPPESVVTVSGQARDGEIAIAVRDQGPGIAKPELDRIFERFYKADKARERGPGGTGLGLSIARHIVEGHGGRIWVESEDGAGSTFTFTIPTARSGRGP
jgi:two-component system, OmpR family, phosphate regulon sensor histidine kinase PhoR